MIELKTSSIYLVEDLKRLLKNVKYKNGKYIQKQTKQKIQSYVF